MAASKRSSLSVPEEELTTHLVVDRRSRISPWGRGNSKLGPGVYTFDRLPGKQGGTCPGSTEECESICYAKRLAYNPPVWDLLRRNSSNWMSATVAAEQFPEDAKLVRIHVSGDFDTEYYIDEWIRIVRAHPMVQFWGYTRSWRVPKLLPALRILRDEPNVQLFASVDRSSELPSEGWRIAWIEDDRRLGAHYYPDGGERPGVRFQHGTVGAPGQRNIPVCPEELGRKKNCVDCGYCFAGTRGDIIFLKH